MHYIIDQPFGIGDILFLSPLVSQIEANKLIWPVADHYIWISDYINVPDLTFIKQSDFNLEHYVRQSYTVIPFQHAHGLFPNAVDCMIAKYMLLNSDLTLFYNFIKTVISRNYKKEQELYKLLGLSSDVPYIIINNNFAGPEHNLKTNIFVDTNIKTVFLDYIDGYTLMDWCFILENAQEIHTVSTSLFFVIESLNTSSSLHLYPRKPLDRDLSPIRSLINEKWICHE